MKILQSAIRWAYGSNPVPSTWEHQYEPHYQKVTRQSFNKFEQLETLPKKHLMALIEYLGQRVIRLSMDGVRVTDEFSRLEYRGAVQELERLTLLFMLILDMKEGQPTYERPTESGPDGPDQSGDWE